MNKPFDISQIQTICNITFNHNLNMLKNFTPDILHYYKNYTPTHFHLMVDQNKKINIFDQPNNNYLYKEDPEKSSHAQVDSYLLNPTRFSYNPPTEDINNKEYPFINHFHLKRLANQKETMSRNEKINYIPSIFFIGVGLGYHIEKIVKEKNVENIFIYEPNPDMFFALLHTIDLYPIFKKMTEEGRSITIQIGNKTDDFLLTFQSFLEKNGLYALSKIYLFKHANNSSYNEIHHEITSKLHRFYLGWGFFEDELLGVNHTISNIKKNNLILSKKNSSNAHKIYDHNMPAIIVGNGPSLDKEIDFLRKNQDNFVIFCSGSALKPLYKAGITPDFQVEIERSSSVYDWIMDINDDAYLKSIMLLGINTIEPKCGDLFKQFIWAFKEQDASYELLSDLIRKIDIESFLHSNPTVVNGSLCMAISLGYQQIYLFGTDFGFKDPKYHHSKNSSYFNDEDTFKMSEMKKELSLPGNFSDEIFSNQELEFSKFIFEMKLSQHKEVECFNCSDGVKINFTTATKSENIDIKNIDKINKKETLEKLINNQTSRSDKINKNTIDATIKEFKKECVAMIDMIQESLKIKPQNINELSLHFKKQFSWVNGLKNNNKKLYILFYGTINSIQCMIFSKAIENNIENFSEIINHSFQIYFEYLEDIKLAFDSYCSEEFNQKNISMYFNKYEENIL